MIRRTLGLVAAVLASAVTAAAQPVPTIELEGSATAPTRSIALWTAAGEATNRAIDRALDRAFDLDAGRSASKIAARAAHMWLVVMPIASFTQVGAHDAGHFARFDEIARGDHTVHITAWPWPVPLVGTVEWSSAVDPLPSPDPFTDMALDGGGEQGALTLRRRLVDRAYSSGSLGYFDATLIAYATFDFPFYAWSDLRPSHLASYDAFYGGEVADFRQYVEAEARAVAPRPGQAPALNDLQRFAGDIRRSAWLNLADTSLWFALDRSVRYIVTGEQASAMPALHIGAVRLSAGTYATLGSTGLERGVDIRLLQASRVVRLTLRNIESPDGSGGWGAGIGVVPIEREGIRPLAEVDVWQGAPHGTGARVEVGLRRRFGRGRQPFDTGFRVGYKSGGYLPDAPMKRGALGAVFTTIRF